MMARNDTRQIKPITGVVRNGWDNRPPMAKKLKRWFNDCDLRSNHA